MRGQRGLDTGSRLKLHLNRDFFRLKGLQLGEISNLITVLKTFKKTFKKIKNRSRPAKCEEGVHIELFNASPRIGRQLYWMAEYGMKCLYLQGWRGLVRHLHMCKSHVEMGGGPDSKKIR